MTKRIVQLALIAAILMPSIGCCWRRGCNKCSAKLDVPPPAPSYYVAPSCPTPCP
jgi:hypothetical protein